MPILIKDRIKPLASIAPEMTYYAKLQPFYNESQIQCMERVLSDFSHIPPGFRVLATICDLLHDDHSEIEDIVEVVKTDAALSIMLVNLANSAQFSHGHLVDSLDEAIERVGFDEVLKMVSLISRHSFQEYSLDPYGIDRETMWIRSLMVAQLSDVLAVRKGEYAGMSYLAGLVHEIGRYAIAWQITRSGIPARLDADADEATAMAWEVALTGLDHIDVGVAYLLKMGFSAKVLEPILAQKDMANASEESSTRAHILKIARGMMPCMMQPKSFNIDDVEGVQESLEAIGLTVEDLKKLLPRTMQRVYMSSIQLNNQLGA